MSILSVNVAETAERPSVTPTDLILGTAGHIDHGKTSLIRALTGVDTDRLPEEKRRGITIELGFAELRVGDFRLGIVDVPGHERFVRNMLCGATGMDLALLVVAADDSVKPQTREHFEILRLLDLASGVIAITKADLVEPSWLELVADEVRELVAGTFLQDAPVVATSVTTGQGLDELRAELAQAARRVVASRGAESVDGPFRMAIDRAFSMAGHVTVVTGSVSGGQCRVGDILAIEPGGMKVRVRGVQNHERPVDAVRRGQRAAINLVGVHHDEIGRGHELAAPGHLRPSRLLSVSLQVLASAPRPLKTRSRVKLHVGTAELAASVRLLGRDQLLPGEQGPAQLFLAAPAATVWSQPLVIRCESPPATIGGGRVLDPHAERIRKADPETLGMLEGLTSPDAVSRASAALYFAGMRDWHPDDLPRTAGIRLCQPVYEQLRQRGDVREIAVSPQRKVRLHRLVLARLYGRIEAALHRLHDANPLRLAHERSALYAGFQYLGENALLDAALDDLIAAGRVLSGPRGIALAGSGPKLTAHEQKLLVKLVESIRAAGLQPPTVKECQQQAAKSLESVPKLLALAAANGELVHVSPDLFLHADADRQARDMLARRLAGSAGLTVSEIREILNTSRKYAVPYCEYLDRIGFTQRQGDLRTIRESSADR
jgi:selenocysteine-specific elongation factor